MKFLNVWVAIMLMLAVDSLGSVTATSGSLSKDNQLKYFSDSDQIELNVNDGKIVFKTTSKTVLFANNTEIEKQKKVYATKTLLLSFMQEGVKSSDKVQKYKNIKIDEKLDDDARDKKLQIIEQKIRVTLAKKLDKTKNLVSYEITDVEIPDNADENIVVEYEISVKVPFTKYRILTYDELVKVFLAPGTPKIDFDTEFLLKDNNKYFLCKVSKDEDDVEDKINDRDVDVVIYSVEIEEELKNKNSTTEIKSVFDDMVGDDILVVAKNSKLPYMLSLATKKSQLQKYELRLIINKNVQKYLQELENLPTKLKGFDFSKEEIRASYKVDTSNGVKYLKTTYKMAGKRKNIIHVTLDGSSYILNPKRGSEAKIVHNAYVVDAKTFLFEIKKTLQHDNSTKLVWSQKVKKSMLELKYKDSDGKTVKKKISRGKKQFYDIAALWYLIHWNGVNDIGDKPFLLMKEDFPFEATYVKKEYGYDVHVKTKERFQFYLDEDKRVKRVVDLQNDLEMVLTKNGFVTETIEKNINYLENMFKKYRLKEVDEND